MKGRSFFCLYFVFLICAAAAAGEGPAPSAEPLAAESGFGAALVLGEPMGLSAKLWLSPDFSLDAGAGWSMYRRTEDGMRQIGAPYFFLEYLYHFYDTVKAKTGKFVYFIGIGAESALDKDLYLGARIPFGMAYMFENAPIDIFLELAPSLVFMPGTTSDTGAFAGLRYWF
ncbi:MAG: DUF3996 domain-containing protein [Spirochaetia bacterium]|nr:DUF3996 domain-containing protein [Spirochaetia bacterium]